MPARTVESKAVRALALAVAALAGTSHAAPPPAPSRPPAAAPKAPAVGTGLTAPLFYQLLVGEMELRRGAAGTAFELLLDAARKTRDEAIFRRATEVALQARAGEQALAAARAWREALPKSPDAHRYVVQILIALNRVVETGEPLGSLYALTPPAQRTAFITTLPRLFARATDTRASASVVEEVLAGALRSPDTRVAAMVSIGRAWLAAADRPRALQLAQRAARLDPAAEAPVLLALEMMPSEPAAESIVTTHLESAAQAHALRRLYARVLVSMQRYADAVAQFETLTREQPGEATPWLSLGALRLELREPRAAAQALERYVQLALAQQAQQAPAAASAATPASAPASAPAASPSQAPAPAALPGAAADEDDDDAGTPAEALVQAYLMLAQSAEQQGDYAGAERWLGKIDDPQRALAVQTRRASLLARQGRLAEARELIRRLPEKMPQDGRAKLMAEAQLLRDAKQWDEAYLLLMQGAEKNPRDTDLLYEQSMVAEKLDRLDEMERLLRRVIELRPDHHHAYNALGYALADRSQRLDEARTLIRKALDLSPGEPFITDSLGWVEYRLGNREEAARLLRQAWQARPDPEIGAHLGEVLWVGGEREEARRVLRDARSRDADNEVLRETITRLRVDL